MRKFNIFYPIVLLMIMALFVVSSGGCGGSSSSTANGTSASEGDTILKLASGMDSNGNGKPDFLDFTGIPQIHLGDTVTAGNISTASSVFAAAEVNLTVPSMIWFKELKPQNDPNVFSIYLEAGKTYTFEFSKNLTEALDDILPSVRIYDPENALLSDGEAEELDSVSVVAYPEEHPSLICYTIKPKVSGNYLVKVCDEEPSTINLDAEIAATEDTTEVNTASVMFVYEERFNKAGEPGYYTRFKIADADGNISDTISVRDVIQLRKEFLKVNPDYFEKVYGYGVADDEYGAGEDESYEINEASNDSYLNFMNIVQDRLGFAKVGEKDTYGDSDEDTYGDNPYDIDKKLIPITAKRSEIPATVTGIPYDDTYELGMGFSAITNLSPVGGIQAMDSFEDELFEKVQNSTLPLATDYYASFVSTREEAEGLTKTNLNASLSKNALGASYSTGSTNNYKFGLTSTNLVIHYEVKESKYRALSNARFEELLEKRTIKSKKAYDQDKIADEPLPDTIDKNEEDLLDESSVRTAADEESMLDVMLELKPDDFRKQFGDYFVCGYQYGACFDAYISISTKTSEQIKEVKQKLAVTATYNGVTASADMSKETKDILKDSGAEVTVRIVTHGMGNKPIELNLTNSTDISAMDTVFSELVAFRNRIVEHTDPKDFAPIRVAMKRWRSLPSIGINFIKDGDDGTIPISVEHATKISEFNTALVNLRAHRNFVMGLGDITPAKKLDENFAKVVAYATDGGNDFYSNLEAMQSALEYTHAVDEQFKKLGDRYVFYTKLVKAQEAEKKTYEDLKDKAAKADGDKHDYIRKMPFGSDHGGSSGYDSFAVSKYVTEDINAGKESHRQYKRTAKTGWRYEWHYDHEKGKEDYLSSAGPATISADLIPGTGNTSDAVFCKVWVTSTATSSERDNKRELVSPAPPAVGKKQVGFEFMGGGTRDVNWNIYGKAMRMRQEDYPFDGLEK